MPFTLHAGDAYWQYPFSWVGDTNIKRYGLPDTVGEEIGIAAEVVNVLVEFTEIGESNIEVPREVAAGVAIPADKTALADSKSDRTRL